MNKYFIVVLIAILVACGGAKEEKDPVSDLKEEVIAVHDEVMPKMGELRKVEKLLRSKADSLSEADSLVANRHVAAADAIEHANEGMMNWMRNFDPNFEGTEEEILKYLDDQKKSIEQVKQKMLQSLDTGKALLEQ